MSKAFIFIFPSSKTEFKISGPRRIPKKVPVKFYYFSVGNHKPLPMRSMANIRKYDLTDILVYKVVCDKFSTDEMLSNVNPQSGMFEIN